MKLVMIGHGMVGTNSSKPFWRKLMINWKLRFLPKSHVLHTTVYI